MKNISNYQSFINIPKNIKIIKNNNILLLIGPLGINKIDLKRIDNKGGGAIKLSENHLFFCSQSKSFFRTFLKLIFNKIEGVNTGFLIYLKMTGIGFRASLEDQTLRLKVGYSHDFKYIIPKSIRVFLIEPTLFCLYGVDKNQITQTAANIKNLKKPSVYKGKGIRLLNEFVHIKQGKRK
jgi:large subunit ribosomal protein L6